MQLENQPGPPNLFPFETQKRILTILLLVSITSLVTFNFLIDHINIFKTPAKLSESESKLNESELMACHLPKLNPFDSSILEFIDQPDPLNCTDHYPLLFRTDLDSKGQPILEQIQNFEQFGYSNCCYKIFWHKNGTEDEQIVSEDCMPIESERIEMNQTIEYIKIECTYFNGSVEVIDMLSFLPLKPELRDLKLKIAEGHQEGQDKVNVVILGLDAISHMNFIRTMPLSHNFITRELGAFKMAGYTKVAENTFVNIVPALMGLTVDEIAQFCWVNDSPLDTCPFIWKNYSSQGYLTAYGEDALGMGTFTYHKEGFYYPPTDYYLIPLIHPLNRELGHSETYNANICGGPRYNFEILLHFVKQMAKTVKLNYPKSQKYFQFVWQNALSHDDVNYPKLGDLMLLSTLKYFQNEGHLNDTVFILMSDHGVRWGNIMDTLQGDIETSMPFIFFVFPHWFKQKYQRALHNLKINENRLTTHFDLHETLWDLLYLTNITDEKVNSRSSELNAQVADKKFKIPRGMSLFLPIPLRRTCKDAEIEDNYCVCRQMKIIDPHNNSVVEEGALKIVEALNKKFEGFSQCLELRLDKIVHAEVAWAESLNETDHSWSINSLDDERLAQQQILYSLTILVEPSKATFESSITRETDGNWRIGGEIARTNLYGEQSWCVDVLNLKKFCFCQEKFII